MKTLTLTSEFFKNECAESFLKAIQGQDCKYISNLDGTFDCRFISKYYENFLVVPTIGNGNPLNPKAITFKLDDSFKVDWACLEFIRGYTFPEDLREQHRLDLDYLSTLEGVEIKEVEE